MSRGGARPGSGRKKGAATQRSREIADHAAEYGVMPLEVMLEAMNKARESGDLEKAAFYAKDAAPYIHPRLSAVSLDLTQVADDDLTGLAEHPSS